jgi:hypothetical protein
LVCDFGVEGLFLTRFVGTGPWLPISDLIDFAARCLAHDLLPELIALFVFNVFQLLTF